MCVSADEYTCFEYPPLSPHYLFHQGIAGWWREDWGERVSSGNVRSGLAGVERSRFPIFILNTLASLPHLLSILLSFILYNLVHLWSVFSASVISIPLCIDWPSTLVSFFFSFYRLYLHCLQIHLKGGSPNQTCPVPLREENHAKRVPSHLPFTCLSQYARNTVILFFLQSSQTPCSTPPPNTKIIHHSLWVYKAGKVYVILAYNFGYSSVWPL